ncbi:putative G3BP-like protein [Prunus avium]|uniref:G3BP-like protein n=1 Tax=Prunus avium TaxID=42229 RepID=A0A6P5SKW2_PRUAV|nr:putative G3BP-like protein [Prunus avium]XP_021814198.1 putative G3BP-like protein [Prunus avium]
MTTPVQQAPASNLPPSADVVGNAFVLQYYNILEQSPQLVHRFYQDISKLGRPGDDGIMSITTTMDAINKKILDYGELSANIVTVDAQESYNGGVFVLVTGFLTGKDNIRKKFTQSFFLAPQDVGYFVLNDVFRYVDDSTPQNGDNGLVVDAAVEAPLTPKHDTTALQGYHVSEPVVVVSEDVAKEEVYNPAENVEVLIEEEEAPVSEVVDEIPDDSQVVAESYSIVEAKSNSKVEAESNSKVEAESNSKVEAESNSKVEAESNSKVEVPKKSYASILKIMKESTVPFSTPAPASVRSVPKKQEQQVTAAPTSVPVSETVVSSTNARENGNLEAEAEGHSIYIKGLPMNSTNALIENEFKKFGLIKNNGVQVRSQKGFCFGFVEYEAASSVQSAMEASPIMIGNRQIFVEEKRSTRGNNRGRFSSGRGNGNGYRTEGGNGYRTEGARGRGGYGGGRAYGRGDSGFKSEFGSRSSNRGGAPSRGGDGYQRSDHGGRVNRPAGVAVNTAAKSTAPQVSASA